MSAQESDTTNSLPTIFKIWAWGLKWPPFLIGVVFIFFPPILYFTDLEGFEIHSTERTELETLFLSTLVGSAILLIWYVIYICVPKVFKNYQPTKNTGDEWNQK